MINFGDILIYVVVFFGLYTAIFFTMTIFQGRDKLTMPKSKWKPKVCIIVPCYNEEKTVSKTLDSLLELNYPMNKLDIIVVDDGSTDDTYKIAKQYEDKGVRVFKKENGGKYTALNLGLEKTDAEIAGALDADSFVDKEALNKLIPYFEDEDVMAVTPSLKIHNPNTFLQMIQRIEYLIGIFLRKVFALLGSVHVAPGPFTLYKTEFFEEHGNYKKAYLTEDIEMALRIQRLHYQIENAPDSYVYTLGPPTFKSLYNQRLRWYYGFIQNVLQYKDLFSRKHGNLGLFVLPSAFISVFLVIIMIFYMVIKTLANWWDQFLYLRSINFDIWQMLEFNFDPFFLNFGGTTLLSLMVIAISVGLIILAKKVAGEQEKIRYSYVVYVAAYWLLFGFWWLAAFYHKAVGKSTKWAHKSSEKVTRKNERQAEWDG